MPGICSANPEIQALFISLCSFTLSMAAGKDFGAQDPAEVKNKQTSKL